MMSQELMDAVIGGRSSEYLIHRQVERYERLKQYDQEFYSIFKKPLHLYCDRLIGFDAQAFWDDMLPSLPDGVSRNSMTVNLFGERAGILIHELIGCITGEDSSR